MESEIQKQGANARANGLGIYDNPFLREAALPAATGESIETWCLKADAWELGWKAADAKMREGAQH